MPTLLLADAPPASDPAAPSLLALAQERVPAGWRVMAAGGACAWRRLAGSDAVAFLGGQRLGGGDERGLASAFSLALAARAAGRRVAFVGVSARAPRARLSRMMARRLVSGSDLLVLSDERSAHALIDAGATSPLRVGSDPLWAALQRPAPQQERRELALLTVGPYSSPQELALRAKAAAEVQLPVAVQPWERSPGRATRRANALARLLSGAKVLDPLPDLGAAQRRFAGAKMVIAGSPRTLAVAASTATPALAVRSAGGLASPSRSVAAEIEAAEEGLRLLRLLLSEGSDGAEALRAGATRFAPEGWSR